jgi:hypothetical protein
MSVNQHDKKYRYFPKKLNNFSISSRKSVFLDRALDYLNLYQLHALILDSSENEYENIKAFSGKINYVHTPNCGYRDKVYQGTRLVNTEYLALMGVDDFLSIAGLREHVTF